jgi:hypothetical protein
VIDEDRVLRLAELAISMRKAVGFRNVLVHDYIEVDDEIVVGRLKGLNDLDEFVRQVAAYVTWRVAGFGSFPPGELTLYPSGRPGLTPALRLRARARTRPPEPLC